MVAPVGVDRLLDVDQASGLVKVEAGIVLRQLNQRLHDNGRAFENLGDIDAQTLAGTISTGTHGTGAKFQNVSAQVHAIELILADGSSVEVSASSNSDGFRAARVGLGALGAIYSVTLKTVPTFRLHRVDHPEPLNEVLDSINELDAGCDHFEFYVFPHTDTALVRESNRTDDPAEPRSAAGDYAQEVVLENWAVGAACRLGKLAPGRIPSLTRAMASQLGRSVKQDHWHKVFASQRRVKFTEMEYGIPREHAAEAVRRVLEVANRPELGVGFPIEVRFVAPDDAMLSPSNQRATCYIAVHMYEGMKWGPYFRAVEEIMASYGGRPHWGKRHSLGSAQLKPLYPEFDAFRKVREKLDPGGTFGNSYTDRVLGRT